MLVGVIEGGDGNTALEIDPSGMRAGQRSDGSAVPGRDDAPAMDGERFAETGMEAAENAASLDQSVGVAQER